MFGELQVQQLDHRTPNDDKSLLESVLFNQSDRISSRTKGFMDVWFCCLVLAALSALLYPPKWQIIPGVYLLRWSNLLYPNPKGFLWYSASLRSKPGLSFVPGCLCKARARGQGRQVVGGSAWSAGTSWIEYHLVKCRLCLERRSSAALARRAGKGWTSRCCTSSPRSVHGKHTLLSAFPAEHKKKSRRLEARLKKVTLHLPPVDWFRLLPYVIMLD